MSVMVPLKYKDSSGVIQTVSADLDALIELVDVPEEKEFSIKITDDQSATETTDFIGISVKR